MSQIESHKKEQQFSNLIRSYRKQHVGKGPEKVQVSFKGKLGYCLYDGRVK
ncbi:uncharacterized protein YbcI [Staphylococcus saprophyticus]